MAYSLTKDVSDGSGNSDFVVKYPCDADRIKALKGLKIRKELARLKEADKYFVPVVEQVIKKWSVDLLCGARRRACYTTYRKQRVEVDTKITCVFYEYLQQLK